MSEWHLTKSVSGGYFPSDPQTEDYSRMVRVGGTIHGNFKKVRNPKFHRKFFALLNFAFDRWEPGEIDCKYGTPEKNFDQFRRDAIILAGYYHIVARMDGTARVEPKSISFTAMDENEFSNLYSAVIDVFLKRIPQLSEMSEEEINDVVDRLVAFG